MISVKNLCKSFMSIDSINFLILLSSIDSNSRLSSDLINRIIKLDSHSNINIPYFTVTSVLLYIKDRECYKEIKDLIIESVLDVFTKKSDSIYYEAELFFIFFDFISCPYIAQERKVDLCKTLNDFKKKTNDEIETFIKFSSKNLYFTSWKNFNFDKFIENKRALEVY